MSVCVFSERSFKKEKKAAEMFLSIAICLVTLQYQAMVVTGSIPDCRDFRRVQRGRSGVIEAREIDPYCRDGACATLHLFDENDVLLCTARGSNPRIRVRGVAKVQTVGDHGCYTIFKRNNYNRNSLCWNHTDRLNIMEADYPYSIVRYVFMIQYI